MPRALTLDQARALIAAAGGDFDALVSKAQPVTAGSTVVVTTPAKPVAPDFIHGRGTCAWNGEKCLQTSGARKGKVHTFTPNSIGRWTHYSCAQGKAASAALQAGKVTEDDLRSGRVTITVKGDKAEVRLAK